MGLEEEAPPLPPRLYSWSDVEDNDDELFQSDDDLDDLSAPVTISDHQKIYSSVSGSPIVKKMHNDCKRRNIGVQKSWQFRQKSTHDNKINIG